MASRAGPYARVRVERLRQVYERMPALIEVSCCFDAGQIAVIMGPNGAGKSTLIGILSTLRRPSAGDVHYGKTPHRLAQTTLRQTIGLLSHGLLLYGDLSGRENLRFFAKMYRLPDGQSRVTALLKQVGMDQVADRPVSQLSRGMAQRVALARTLLHDPHLLLLDEPFTGLDRQAIDVLREQLAMCREAGKIIAVVTHDVQALDGLADKLLVLARGRIVEESSVARPAANELMEHYLAAVR
jgi:heme exporter protein A